MKMNSYKPEFFRRFSCRFLSASRKHHRHQSRTLQSETETGRAAGGPLESHVVLHNVDRSVSRVSAAKQMKGGSVPDVQLEQSKTLREQRSQNHQPLHRRAAAVQAARQTVRINDTLPPRSAWSFCFSESYTIFSETLNFGTNSVRVFNVCSSQQPPDKLRRNKRSGNYRTVRGTCFSDRSSVKFRIIWQIRTKQEILPLSAERQLKSAKDLETEMI